MNRQTRALLAVLALALAGCDAMPKKDSSGPTAESVSITGEAGDARNRARVHAELAALYVQRGNMAIALEELRIAAAADSNYPLTYSLFGLVYMELRETKLAQENFERALRLSPNDADINHNYGWFLCQSGRETESIKYFMQAVSNPLYPMPWRSYSAAGVCSMRKNNLKEADEFFQRALKQEPDEPGSLLQLAQIRYRQGNMEEARRFVTRHNRVVPPGAESLWLALRIERKLGDRNAEANHATQLRRRFATSREYQQLQRGEYD